MVTRVTVKAIEPASIGAASNAFRARTLSPVELMKVTVERAATWEPLINAFVSFADGETLLEQARAAESRWARGKPMGALDGVPITVKDTVPVQGFTTRRGSRTTDAHQPETFNAPAVERLREAGAIIVGKTTTPEFGWKVVTDSPLSGVTRNPWNLDLTPGGSSGGSASALAAGIGFASIGTDAAGSLRVPSAFTGLVGFKATAGRMPRFPPSGLGSLGHVGPICRNVDDIALLTNLLSCDDVLEWPSAGLTHPDCQVDLAAGVRGLRIAFSARLGFAEVDPEVAAIVRDAVGRLSTSGARVEETDPPLQGAYAIYRTLLAAGLGHAIQKTAPQKRQLLDSGLLEMLRRLGTPSLTEYLVAEERRAELGRKNRAFHERHDILCTPTVAVPPFAVSRLSPEGWDPFDWMAWTPFTYPFNLTGQPCVTVPCGYTRSGLPVGIQLVGRLGADPLVLRAAKSVEEVCSEQVSSRPSPSLSCDEAEKRADLAMASKEGLIKPW